MFIEGSLEVKLPTIWTHEKQRWEESKKRREEERRSKRESVRRKKIQVREKVGKSRNTAFFQWFVAPEGRKVGSLKRRVRSQPARWEMKNCTPLRREAHFEAKMYKTHQVPTTLWKLRCWKSARRCGSRYFSKSKCTKHTMLGPLLEVEISKSCTPLWREANFEVNMIQSTPGFGPCLEVEISKKCTPLWREAHFEVKIFKMYIAHHARTTFGSCDVEKVHAVVARSTFRSKHVQNILGSDHFWKLRCRKSARRCGAKHISKSKCTKHTMLGPLLEVAMSKKCAPLWREAHVEVKMLKAPEVQTTFGRSDVVSRGRRKGLCTLPKMSKTGGFCSIFNYNHHYTHHTTLQYKLQLQLHLHSTTLHYTHYTPLHYTQLNSITLNYTQLHSITLNYTTQHTTLHYTTQHDTTRHYTTLIALHYTTLHHTTPHFTTPHHTHLHYTTLPYPTLHYITVRYTTLITPPQMQLQLHYTNYTTPQIQPHYTTTTTTAALHHSTSSSKVTDQVTTATNATTAKNTTPTTFRSISGFAPRSVIHNNQSLV